MMPKQQAQVQLNPQQQKAVDFAGSVTVVSGAGTGKTRVITERVRKIMRERNPEEHIVALTFSNRAAKEMRDRTGYEANLFIGTFHAFGLRLLREFPEYVGYRQSLVVLDITDQAAMVRRIMHDLEIETEEDTTAVSRKLTYLISDLKLEDRTLNSSDFQKLGITQIEFENIYKYYFELMQKENKVDFSDLLLLPIYILENNEKVRTKLSERYSYFLVDELQDIDRWQLEMMKLLQAKNTVFFGVGDDDQSIYRFRGADPKLMRKFSHEFTKDNIVRLEHNYRSTENILKLANEIIRENPGRMSKDLSSGINGREKPVLIRYQRDQDEARDVARKINQLIDAQKVVPGQIAVLYRNNVLSNLIEQALTNFQIPFRVRGGQRFFERAEVKDLLAYLRFATDPDDLTALLRSINTPKRSVGNVTKEKITREVAAGANLWEYLSDSQHEGVTVYCSIIQQIQSANGLIEKTKTAIEASGLVGMFQEKGYEEKTEHLGEILNAAKRFGEQTGEDATMSDFLAACALDDVENTIDESVSLLTIHSAKGLEFDHVFIVGLEDEILPSANATPGDVAEDCRLLYVATTRAAVSLNLSYTCQRFRWGKTVFPNLTRYLKRLQGTELLKFRDMNRHDGSPVFARSKKSKIKPEQAPESLHTINGITTGTKVISSMFGPGVVLRLEKGSEGAKAHVLFFRDKKPRWLVMSMHELKPMKKMKTA